MRTTEDAARPLGQRGQGQRCRSTYVAQGNAACPKAAGTDMNSAGQDVLDDILTNPLTAERSYVHPNYGPVREFFLPHTGARCEDFGRLGPLPE